MTSDPAFTWGPRLVGSGARFRLWAPQQPDVSLVNAQTDRGLGMHAIGDGWFELETDIIPQGGGYAFRLADGRVVPDPAAREQIGDVHGPSRLIDPTTFERDTTWKGRPWSDAAIYELHTGTFSAEGTFAGLERKLDHIRDAGFTAIELMPVAQFSGERGWGYDGVLLYAPHNAYGGAAALHKLVRAAHERDLMVLLDVVYNHFGPEGNYLSVYAADFFHPERQTPWGSAIAFDRPAVRSFFIENALFWLQAYGLDGLRLDAIDQIDDQSPEPILEELARRVRATIADRHIHLTTEDDRNITRLHARSAENVPQLYTAEWNDDFHHVAHTLATGDSEGYYADYSAEPARLLLRALTDGYVYQGEESSFREGEKRGEPSRGLPPSAFVNFLQNHDQIGNRALGERLTVLASDAINELLTAILFLSPYVPLSFMGDEYGEVRPFCYFTAFEGDLANAVREGRRNEFRKWRQFADPEMRERIPDPNARDTFEASKLDWQRVTTADGAKRLELVRRLLSIRMTHLAPHLGALRAECGNGRVLGPRAFEAQWSMDDGSRLVMHGNLASERVDLDKASAAAVAIYESAEGVAEQIRAGGLPGMSVCVTRMET